MLEVNDFNAVRISLASPEQIRSWSYGEVTKPETINYRTLKPEKDGLFCERIFGPTKDFECYCGKYKKIRYKGIICDKCGVEVARARVRRERMGHIELAAPAAHIWFSLGIPSRMGLLLDLSPRSLERVLYFAQYVVTQVDEEARKKTIEQLQDESGKGLSQIALGMEEKVVALKAKREEAEKALNDALEAEIKSIEERQAQAIATLKERAASVEKELKEKKGKAAAKDIAFEDKVLVAKGDKVTATAATQLKKLVPQKVAELESKFQGQRQDRTFQTQEQVSELQKQYEEEASQLQHPLSQEKAKRQEELNIQIEEIEELRPLHLLTESKYRELKDKYGNMFEAGMGAEAIFHILKDINLDNERVDLKKEISSTSGQRRKKASKRLRVVEAFRRSGNKPEWMIMTVLPVLPPELRPMVQLDGGRFATSDLNDLYRRVINRNNRLRRLLELIAPEIIVRNEKRMLQEAVDSLIDNGRRGRAVSTGGNHRLKSLSDMLRGKQGRFRQNLLGKRVDYSGRSVIVAGPELKLHQCGLPKRMALELFKPFVMRRLVEMGYAHNIKSARRLAEKAKPEVWDILEEIVKERPVLLNRAPTLHRLGIQAFEPVLIDGGAIQIHPLVCTAFNADFDGDQMAVHLPLSQAAVREAREMMLSVRNMLLPSSGDPVVAPTLDIVLGCFYLTTIRPGSKGEGMYFGSMEEAKLACDLGIVDLGAEIEVRDTERGGQRIKTSLGRILFNDILPAQLRFRNEKMDKGGLKRLAAECYRLLGNEGTAAVLDSIKQLGFHYATISGTTVAISDIEVPQSKAKLLEEADEKIAVIENQFRRGLITDEERYTSAVQVWNEATDKITQTIERNLHRYGGIFEMATAGAKGNIAQIRQMAGMRGLMTDPSGRIIDFPIKSSFREGLSVLEYFISTHGARKGLADTALRTSDSGYLTRRLIDVAQDVIIREPDCNTTDGVWISSESVDKSLLPAFTERIVGRMAASKLVHPKTGETIIERNQEIDEAKAQQIVAAGITSAHVRSPLTCQARQGICQHCHGRDLARGHLASIGTAAGIIAAQSIGEPGTQLTMRTFHTGGIVGIDITSGLPRVEELFEARAPKGEAVISEIDGIAEVLHSTEGVKIKIISSEVYRDEYSLPAGSELMVKDGDLVQIGAVLAQPSGEAASGEQETKALTEQPVVARVAGKVSLEAKQVFITYEEKEEREYVVGMSARVLTETGARVKAGEQLTDGHVNPQDMLRIMGREATQQYLVNEVQKVYRSQGVNINDKHIEIIVRQMLTRVRVESSGDTELLPGELVDRFVYEDINAKVLAEGGEPATAQTVLLGITRSSLNTDSWLAAASFQETTRVLTEAAISGKVDRVVGLKENVIIGRLIPARAPDLVPLPTKAEAEAPTAVEAATAVAEVGSSETPVTPED